MKNSKSLQRGLGKVEFNQNLNFIRQELQKGQTAAYIYRVLRNNGKIQIKERLFRHYISKLRASEQAGKPTSLSPASSATSALDMAPASVTLSPPSVSSHSESSPVVVGTSERVLFQPEPADMDDEFDLSSSNEGDGS